MEDLTILPVPRLKNLNAERSTLRVFGGAAWSKSNIIQRISLTWHRTCHVTMYHYPQRALEGGEHMSASDRRQRLLEVLCLRRHDTYDNLANKFHVCKRTIRYDIAALMCAYPIETVCGRYGGGVKIADDYYPYRRTLNKKQVKLLIKLSAQLDGEDLATISSIIFQLAP